MRTLVSSIVAVALLVGVAGAAKKKTTADKPKPTKEIIYKTTKNAKGAEVQLKLHVFLPDGHKASDKRAAIVFFFGGGWVGGSPSQFYTHSEYLASRGMVAMSAEYRVKSRDGTTPKECVKDGKSAIRYVRAHAAKLGIDPDRVAAGGGSAGGHVAAATATVTAFNEDGEDTSVSAVPNALALFNAVYNNGPDGGWNQKTVKDYWEKISPAHNIRKGMPPAIVFLGTQDKLIPVATAKKFQADMKAVGSRSELMLFEGQGHGFFNQGKGGNAPYTKTVHAMDKFLASLGFLKGEPTIKVVEK